MTGRSAGMMLALDAAPDLDVAFPDEQERDPARKFMALLAASQNND